ncbi:hypothetical protein [Nocardioides lijunqiniae]|uniref:hypothetical protein n=1 Tax=Nocardioides lijunqiniae TaxID=2760832 RepID=UPI0018777F24|nr:hypothetical protein [Nocardioides lijunqiniae]
MTTPKPPRCDRPYAHGPHTFVSDPASDVDVACVGRRGPRHLSLLLAERPQLDGVGVAPALYQLEVMSA